MNKDKVRFNLNDAGGERALRSKLEESVDRNKTWGGLSMSRVPSGIRDEFVELARDNFANDYGACLTYIFMQCGEYNAMKGQLINLGSVIERLNQLELMVREHIGVEQDEVETALDGSPLKKKKAKK